MRRWWLAVLISGALFATLSWTLTSRRGLSRSVFEDGARSEFAAANVADVGLDGVDAGVLSRRDVTVIWRAAWRVPTSGLYVLGLQGRGWSSWMIDGHLANEHAGADDTPFTRAVRLAAGLHAIELRYRPDPSEPR